LERALTKATAVVFQRPAVLVFLRGMLHPLAAARAGALRFTEPPMLAWSLAQVFSAQLLRWAAPRLFHAIHHRKFLGNQNVAHVTSVNGDLGTSQHPINSARWNNINLAGLEQYFQSSARLEAADSLICALGASMRGAL
jgi:hypothetical protein